MEKELTKQDILELFEKQSDHFESLLQKERFEREQSRKDFDKKLENERKDRLISRKEFDKKLGEITNTWGRFVSEMVTPRLVEMFQKKGIPIETTVEKVKGFENGQEYYEIDLLLINSKFAVAVEVKSKLDIAGVKEHIDRLKKIQKVCPKRIDLKGMTVYGAVAGIVIEENADKFAYRNGLYVLKQKGNIVEIANDDKFEATPYIVEY
ncbi:MAG: hypothetical protein NT004_11885 [Bacteroidetes bacterium]|nr:hypothetical protein [Bacteroidota bacterium]